MTHYIKPNEFLYFKFKNKRRKHILVNINNTLSILKTSQNMQENIIMECELYLYNEPTVKDVWIRINLTSMLLSGNNLIIETLYINKYNFNHFAIKITTPNLYGGNNSTVYFIKPIKRILLSNHCNYYSAYHFQHLPESAINKMIHPL